MKNLALERMEEISGGVSGANKNLAIGTLAVCGVVGLVSIAGSFFTFGASLAFGVLIADSMCLGFTTGIGIAAYNE